MEGLSLKSRAVAFAMCAGAVAFILALVATSGGGAQLGDVPRALIPAIVCAVMCWASAERSITGTAAAIDAAIARLAHAAQGDLSAEIPAEIAESVPQLATAMRALFAQLHVNMESVQRLAMFDTVTGLANRTNFRRTCERLLITACPGSGGVLFFIDLDRFKVVNDTMGHACGDMLLGMVANRLRAVVETVPGGEPDAGALIGRLAGDEFTIFLPQMTDPDKVTRVARDVLSTLSDPFDLAGTEVSIGASIGIAQHPRHGETLTELMRAADAAMYHAKNHGRGRVEHFSEELAARIAERTVLENDLREAINLGEFLLMFQPQVSMERGEIVAAEALLRWRHPRDGLRLPGTFLPCAEETGLIVEIGEWVVAAVTDTIARWGRMGIEQRLAINISPRELDHVTFFRRLRDAMRTAAAPARLLELEITESLAMHCSDDVVEAITLLRADGATIAIDDFGTGYSNLSRLRALPVDRVKLDRSLIEHVAEDANARAIAQAVIGLIHGIECEAVGEGIETAAQADILRILGCDVIQGYAIAAPMAEQDFITWSKAEMRMGAAG